MHTYFIESIEFSTNLYSFMAKVSNAHIFWCGCDVHVHMLIAYQFRAHAMVFGSTFKHRLQGLWSGDNIFKCRSGVMLDYRFWITFRAGIFLEFHLSHSEGFLGATFIFRPKMLKNNLISFLHFFSVFFSFFLSFLIFSFFFFFYAEKWCSQSRTGRSDSDAPGLE